MKKFLCFILTIMFLMPITLSLVGCDNRIVITIGQNGDYSSLSEAVNEELQENKMITFKLLENINGNGIVIDENCDVVFDLNGKTYLVDGETVGSTGTKTNGFQLLKNSNVVFKNGTIKQNGAKILIQNYSNLTLDNATIDARSESLTTCGYAISNNFGSLTVKGNSNIYAYDGKTAFDVWYGMKEVYYDGVSVKFEKNFTGTVQGKIEYGAQTINEGWLGKTKIEIMAGTFNIGQFVRSSSNYDFTTANVKIYGGNFDIDVSTFTAEGYKCELQNDRYVVSKI